MQSPDRLMIGGTRRRLLELLRRKRRTIAELAEQVGLSGNAVRMHLSALQRDGLVDPAGVHRDTGGKPAQVYDITRETEELFPKAYAAVLTGLLEELESREGPEAVGSLLRGVGARVAAGVPAEGGIEARVQRAAAVLRSLGADLEVERVEGGWLLQGYGCPLSAVVEERHEVCHLVEELVADVVDAPVRECCDRGERPRCGFRISVEEGGPRGGA
jgi:predicted ArsR family transcriptional regulator